MIKFNYVAVHEHGTGPGRLWLDHEVRFCLCMDNTEVVKKMVKIL